MALGSETFCIFFHFILILTILILKYTLPQLTSEIPIALQKEQYTKTEKNIDNKLYELIPKQDCNNNVLKWPNPSEFEAIFQTPVLKSKTIRCYDRFASKIEHSFENQKLKGTNFDVFSTNLTDKYNIFAQYRGKHSGLKFMSDESYKNLGVLKKMNVKNSLWIDLPLSNISTTDIMYGYYVKNTLLSLGDCYRFHMDQSLSICILKKQNFNSINDICYKYAIKTFKERLCMDKEIFDHVDPLISLLDTYESPPLDIKKLSLETVELPKTVSISFLKHMKVSNFLKLVETFTEKFKVYIGGKKNVIELRDIFYDFSNAISRINGMIMMNIKHRHLKRNKFELHKNLSPGNFSNYKESQELDTVLKFTAIFRILFPSASRFHCVATDTLKYIDPESEIAKNIAHFFEIVRLSVELYEFLLITNEQLMLYCQNEERVVIYDDSVVNNLFFCELKSEIMKDLKTLTRESLSRDPLNYIMGKCFVPIKLRKSDCKPNVL